jgi:hypothetical protein
MLAARKYNFLYIIFENPTPAAARGMMVVFMAFTKILLQPNPFPVEVILLDMTTCWGLQVNTTTEDR